MYGKTYVLHLQVFFDGFEGPLEVALVRVAEDDILAPLPVEVRHHGEGDEPDGRLQLGMLRVDQQDHASPLTLSGLRLAKWVSRLGFCESAVKSVNWSRLSTIESVD